MTGPDADILHSVRERFPASIPKRLAVAVSGGGDSVALLHILTRAFGDRKVALQAVTVDHGLRPGSAEEAAGVARLCAGLGVGHTILHWEGWDGSGNLQDQARRARYRLLAQWARAQEIAIVTLGHTADDQAETVLMRLARAAGVTGLSGIPERRATGGVTLMRPLLHLTRAELRDYLRRNGIAWVEDPSNEDSRFERVRARQALAALEPLGISVQALAQVARNMTQAREALDWYTFLAARDQVSVQGGDVVIDHRQFRVLPDETARRLLLAALAWVGQEEYPPRSGAMIALLRAARLGRAMTLAGCHVLKHGDALWVTREFRAVSGLRVPVGALWDGRWRLADDMPSEGLEIAALGRAGLGRCPDPRATGRPVPALIASPAVWRGSELVAAPLAGFANGWKAEPVFGGEEFFASLLSH